MLYYTVSCRGCGEQGHEMRFIFLQKMHVLKMLPPSVVSSFVCVIVSCEGSFLPRLVLRRCSVFILLRVIFALLHAVLCLIVR